MSLILKSDDIRRAEETAFAAGLPIPALMEKAALLAFQKFSLLFPANTYRRVGVLAGPGHNGGDALVIARECLLSGRDVVVWSTFESHKDLTASHLRWYRELGGVVAEDISQLGQSDVLIDGLLGFGTSRAAEGTLEMAINWANRTRKPIVAIDVPSGLNTDTGERIGATIRASHTLTLGTWKECLIQDESQEHTGNLSLIDIGIPESHLNRILSPSALSTRTLEPQSMMNMLPPERHSAGHKYSHGRLLISAGSSTYPGAAVLSALGARCLGIGYLVVDTCTASEKALLEIAPDCVFKPGVTEDIRRAIGTVPNAVVLGPGLMPDAPAIPNILATTAIPQVIDAGALAFLSDNFPYLALTEQQILTPHSSEFKNLFPALSQITPKSDQTRAAAQACGAIVVHKGPRTTIAHPNGQVRVNLHSTAALARAGTGDVLAGMMGALLAQKFSPFDAACAAVWLHSHAALSIVSESNAVAVDPMRLIAAVENVLSRRE